MDLTPLDGWLRVSTWNTFHPADEKRFHKAVLLLMQSNGATGVDPSKLKRHILETYQGKFEKSYLENIAERYADKYEAISSFYYDNGLLP